MAERTSSRPALLAPEDLAQTLQTIQTLLSLYADPDLDDADDDGQGDVDLDSTNEAAVRSLAEFLTLPLSSLGDARSTKLRDGMPDGVAFGLRLRPWRGGSGDDAKRALWLNVKLPIRRTSSTAAAAAAVVGSDKDAVRWAAWSVRKADWLEDEHYVKLVSAAQKAADSFQRETRTAESGDGLQTSYILHVAEILCEEAVIL